jgi:hypothetical protein
MAKKAKKTKKAKKAKKAAKRTTAPGKKTVTVPMQSVVQFVKMLISQGHDGEFETSAKNSRVLVSLDGAGTTFVKDFLARNSHLRPAMAAHVRDPCPGNPFEC